MSEVATILVVDNEEKLRNLLLKVLEKEGYQVLMAGTNHEAFDLLANNNIDIVLLDVKMPKVDGFEFLKSIKKDYPDIGIIVMTAFGDAYTVRDALLLGADEYITKPFNNFEIIMVVERTYWRMVSSRSPEKSPS